LSRTPVYRGNALLRDEELARDMTWRTASVATAANCDVPLMLIPETTKYQTDVDKFSLTTGSNGD